MAIVTEILASLALLLFVCFGVQAQQEYYDVVGSEIDSKNHNFVYAQCERSDGLVGSPVNCTVFIKRLGTSNERSCSLQLHGHGSDTVLVDLRRFDDSKIVMMWVSLGDETDVYIGIRKVDDCSLIHHVRYSVDNILALPLLYKNGFDIFIKNETICAGVVDYSCRVSFDTEGNCIGDPVPFKHDLHLINMWTVSPDLPAKGFFLFGYTHEKESNISLAIKRVEPTGKTIDLISSEEALIGYSDMTSIDSKRVRVSNAHEYIGVCWDSPSGGIDCRQFDAADKVRLNVSALVVPVEERLVGVHNLADDGMLIATEIGKNTFQIRKIDATGVFGRAQKVSHQCYKENPMLWLQITETEEELILYFVCYADKTDDLFKANFLRLPKKDFI